MHPSFSWLLRSRLKLCKTETKFGRRRCRATCKQHHHISNFGSRMELFEAFFATAYTIRADTFIEKNYKSKSDENVTKRKKFCQLFWQRHMHNQDFRLVPPAPIRLLQVFFNFFFVKWNCFPYVRNFKSQILHLNRSRHT